MSNTNLGVQYHGFIFVPPRPQERHHQGLLDIYRRDFALTKESWIGWINKEKVSELEFLCILERLGDL